MTPWHLEEHSLENINKPLNHSVYINWMFQQLFGETKWLFGAVFPPTPDTAIVLDLNIRQDLHSFALNINLVAPLVSKAHEISNQAF